MLLLLEILAFAFIAASVPSPGRLTPTASRLRKSIGPANANALVDPELHPDWAGQILKDDCNAAWRTFRQRVRPYPEDLQFTFWSRQWMHDPPIGPAPFELPFGVQHGTCVLLLRMVKDFGDDILPVPGGGFFGGDACQPLTRATWRDVLSQAKELIEEACNPWWPAMPGWIRNRGDLNVGRNVAFLLLSEASAMSQVWAFGMRNSRNRLEGLIADNSTQPLVKEESVLSNGTAIF